MLTELALNFLKDGLPYSMTITLNRFGFITLLILIVNPHSSVAEPSTYSYVPLQAGNLFTAYATVSFVRTTACSKPQCGGT